MASPQWPAPTTTVVVFATAAVLPQQVPDQATSTVTLVGLVRMS